MLKMETIESSSSLDSEPNAATKYVLPLRSGSHLLIWRRATRKQKQQHNARDANVLLTWLNMAMARVRDSQLAARVAPGVNIRGLEHAHKTHA